MFSDDKFMDINHPNPQFYRPNYTILNGEWNFLFDKNNKGDKKGFSSGLTNPIKINVPYVYNTEKSLINSKERCNHVWYEKHLNLDELKDRYILHFEGVDYVSSLYINGSYLGTSKGGYHRVSYDITDYLVLGDNLIVLKCSDSLSRDRPRGKQRFTKKNMLCWYEDMIGIYKTVWIENVKDNYIKHFHMIPSKDNKKIDFSFELNGIDSILDIELSFGNKVIKSESYKVSGFYPKVEFKLNDDIKEWDVLNPTLYDLKFTLKENDVIQDTVYSYVAFRDIKIENKKIYLNGKELYQKLVLDQGYFDKSLLTTTYEELDSDMKNMIASGFNGARKHQKIEDERFYYLADKYGYLVWAEMPSMYTFTAKSRENFSLEYFEVLKQLYNHPSIITWVIMNESWGIINVHRSLSQISFMNMLYVKTKDIDRSRIVITNDGWDHTVSDIFTIHLYEQESTQFKNDIDLALSKGIIKSFIKKHAYAKGYSYNDVPIMVSEFGGTSFVNSDKKSWGYGKEVTNKDEYLDRLSKLFEVIQKDDRICGYCYTQLSDVYQEVNGIYTMDRTPKVDVSLLKNIQDRR